LTGFGRFDRRTRPFVPNQDQRIEHLGGRNLLFGEGAAPFAGEVARTYGCGVAVPPALSGSYCQREVAADLYDPRADYPGIAAVLRRAGIYRTRDANAAPTCGRGMLPNYRCRFTNAKRQFVEDPTPYIPISVP